MQILRLLFQKNVGTEAEGEDPRYAVEQINLKRANYDGGKQ